MRIVDDCEVDLDETMSRKIFFLDEWGQVELIMVGNDVAWKSDVLENKIKIEKSQKPNY